MAHPHLRDLIWLGQAETPAPQASDLRGRRVTDANGEEVGAVDDLLVDDAGGGEIRFVRIAESDSSGVAPRHYLVPIDAVVRINPARVRLDRDKDQVADAPAYDPDHLDTPYYERLYDYYGYRPFWDPGYAYPTDLYRP